MTFQVALSVRELLEQAGMVPLSLRRVPKSAPSPVIFVCFRKSNSPREGP